MRARIGVEHGRYGHLLAPAAAEEGRNFVLLEAFEAARARQKNGKGVAPRTFENMLSSQGMCFNVFAPLQARLELASELLRPFVPGLAEVRSIDIEYTPPFDVFFDQSGRGGVDCDLLIEGTNADGEALLLVVETKFVEPGFSVCGFRRPGRASKGKDVCPSDVPVHAHRGSCLYTRNKGYAYWERSDQHRLLRDDALGESGCPFADGKWQLWVNLALAHEEASRRGASDVRLAVCTSRQNDALLGGGAFLDEFRSLLRRPASVYLLDLEGMLDHLATIVPPDLTGWATALAERYQGI